MNTMIESIGKYSEIKEILLLLGPESDAELIFDLIRVQELEKLTICYYDENKKKKYLAALRKAEYEESFPLPTQIEWTEGYHIADSSASFPWALVFDSLNSNEKVLRLASLNPDYLFGTLDSLSMDAFTIWERYRSVSKRIVIDTQNPNRAPEVLDWTKNEKSDVELSVIFPMYNIARYLPQCIESVTAWKADYIEYLFVDDGSPDNCAEIVKEYAEKDSRIKLFQKKNGGCASARQYGLAHAEGSYIGFIDPDDYIDESMFRKLLSRALTGSYEISYSGYKELYEESGTTREIEDVLGWPYCDGTFDPAKIDELIAYRRIAIWRGIYSKDLIKREEIHFYEDLRRFDDLPFKVETLARARSVVSVPEYLYYYRMSRPGQDVAADDERLYVHFPIFEHLQDFFKRIRDKRQIELLEVVKIQTHRWALEKLKSEFVAEYCCQAKSDLDTNFDFRTGINIIKRSCSKSDLAFYKAIRKNKVSSVRRLIKKYASK